MAIRFWEIFEETRGQYQLRLLAGKNGMDSVVSWVHMVEDETIISRFGGTELAVTTGMKAGTEGWLLRLVTAMKKAGCICIPLCFDRLGVHEGQRSDRLPTEELPPPCGQAI